MIFNIDAQPLLAKYAAARESEALATKDLLAAFQSGVKDTAALEALSNRMETAHNLSMDIWNQLQPLALDK